MKKSVNKETMPAHTSVIITAFNHEQFIKAAIHSVLEQTDSEWECLVVDDGSADGSFAAAEKAAQGDGRIRIFRKANGGTGSARNFGALRICRESRYLVFLDGDDQLERTFIKRLSTYLDENPLVDSVTCGFVSIAEDGSRIGLGYRSRSAPGWLGLPHKIPERVRATPFVSFYCATGMGPFAMHRRKVFEAVGGYTTDFCPHEDTDLFCKIALCGEVHHLPEALYLKRKHSQNTLTARKGRSWTPSTFKPNAYSLFRAKWNNWIPQDARQADILAAARRYYFGRHRPARQLRIAWRA